MEEVCLCGKFLFKISCLAFIFLCEFAQKLILGWAMDGYRMGEPWVNPGRMTDERTMVVG